MEVRSQDHSPNVLSRETIFLIGIFKACFILRKNNSDVVSADSTPENEDIAEEDQKTNL